MGFLRKRGAKGPGKMMLGEALVRAGKIQADQLATAIDHQQRKGYRIGYHLVKLGYIDDAALGDFLAEQYGVPAIDDDSIHIHPDLFKDIPHRTLLENELLPLHRAGNTLTLVMCDPSDAELLANLSNDIGMKINPVVAPQSVVRKHLAHYFALREIRDKLGVGGQTDEVTEFFTQLKDYRFEKVLGVGGFGMVCKCWQVSLDRFVAVKTMNRGLSDMPGMSERFQREGKIIARLNHPNIIQVYEQGEAGGLLYIVMQFFEGQEIDERCREKDLVERIGVLIPLCDALHYAYGQGVVHRDLKPANILANDLGEVKLLDFGVAYFQSPDDARLTQQNVILGTPKYMAPECFDGATEAGTEADIYAMGVLAYELLTGSDYASPPKAPSALNPNIPPILSTTIMKALEPDRSQRLRSFDLFKRAFQHSRDQMLMGHTVVADAPPVSPQKPSQAPLEPESDRIQSAYEEERCLRDDDEARVIVARHHQMNRKVVVKRIASKWANSDTLERLKDIQHPNVGQVLGTGEEDGHTVVVMEYLDGGTLTERMQAGALSAENVAVWSDQMVAGLEAARNRGVLHTRLHPGNILFTSENQLKVVGFGESGQRSTTYARYSRPEIRDPWELDRYALGVIWFEMLSGERFRGARPLEKNFQKVQNNHAIEAALKVPLGRLWGMRRYGRRYETYADMTEDLRFVREKICPTTPTASGKRGKASPPTLATSPHPWWAFWR